MTIYLAQSYRDMRAPRRSVREWFADSALALCIWSIVAAGVAAAVVPIWV